MAGHSPAEIDPQTQRKAEDMWDGFTALMKWSVIFCGVIVALLGLIFIDW